MTAILVLEDGRQFRGSSMAIDGVLTLASREIDDKNAKLRRWLADKANRPAPFQDFDLRGLDEIHRAVFWHACARALSRLEQKHGAVSDLPENHWTAYTLARFMEVHRSIEAGEPPPATDDSDPVRAFDGRYEDLDDIWEPDET
jgi:hypothetical protein